MDAATVAKVRRFNRTVTQRVGALDDRFLSLDRPLGEARLLWEIGPEGSDLRDLRARLDLDSGYLSRLLRSLEGDGLVTVDPDPGDRRVRRARRTASGEREATVLDRRSDELAVSMLDPLSESQRERPVEAMTVVERLLTAAMVEIEPTDPEHPHAQHCLGEYAKEIDRRFAMGFDAARSTLPDPAELGEPSGVLLVATLRSEPIGCGGLRFHDGEPTELKRMWIDPSVRGFGVGRRLLGELEARAAEHHPVARLDTNESLTEAIAMYRATGYREVDAFNDEVQATHWFEKRVGS